MTAEQTAALAVTASPVVIAMAIHAWLTVRKGDRR